MKMLTGYLEPSRGQVFISGAKKGELRLQVSDQPYRYRVSPGLKAELQGYTRAQLSKVRDSKAQQKAPVVSPPPAG